VHSGYIATPLGGPNQVSNEDGRTTGHDSGHRVDWVVFDLGGVVLTETRALPELAARLSVPAERFVTAYYQARPDYDRTSDRSVYWSAVAAACRAGRPDEALTAELVTLDDEGWSTTDPATLDLIEDLHTGGTRLAVLSNAPASMGALVRSRPWAAAFQQVLISGELGLIKPDPAIYAELLRALGAAADRVVFLDDRADNVQAALACGIRAFRFTDAGQARSDLAGLGLVV
jgi:putative hydrolase of the HAD superfamily